jgi:hypothetical protein
VQVGLVVVEDRWSACSGCGYQLLHLVARTKRRTGRIAVIGQRITDPAIPAPKPTAVTVMGSIRPSWLFRSRLPVRIPPT